MWGELASLKDFKPSIPRSHSWASSVHFNFHLLVLLYFYMDLYFDVHLCVRVVCLSRRGCLYIYTIVCIIVQLIHVHNTCT